MYLPLIMISLVYMLRALMRHLMPKNLKVRQFLIFILAMYALILFAGCFTGFSRWLAFQTHGKSTYAQVIFNGKCTDHIFIEGRHRRMYKKILAVPAEQFDSNFQPFADDTGHGSLIYRLHNAAASASVAATVENAMAGVKGVQGQLRLGNNSIVQHTEQLPAISEEGAVDVAKQLSAAAAQRAAEDRANEQFPCIGYRFQSETGEWIYAQEDGTYAHGQQLLLRYYPQHPEENWLESTIPQMMRSSIRWGIFLIGVLAETFISGYFLGIRRQRKLLAAQTPKE